jgi:predicted transcriptional regulator YdeE
MQTLIIPAQHYVKITSPSDKTAEEVLKLWQYIWHADPAELGGDPNHMADFEIYRPEAHNPDGSSVELYASLKMGWADGA